MDLYLSIAGGFQLACTGTVGAFFNEIVKTGAGFEIAYLTAFRAAVTGIASFLFYSKAKYIIKNN